MLKKPTHVLAAIAVTCGLLFLSSFEASRCDDDWRFVVAPGVCVVALCIAGEWFVFGSRTAGLGLALAAGVARGGVQGATAWVLIMALVPLFKEVGDKFPIVIIGLAPFAFVLGAIAGGVARLVRLRSGSR